MLSALCRTLPGHFKKGLNNATRLWSGLAKNITKPTLHTVDISNVRYKMNYMEGICPATRLKIECHARSLSNVSKESKFTEEQEFNAVFPEIIRDITEITDLGNSKEISSWVARAMQFNVPHGKKHRGLLTVGAYKNLVHEQHQTKENIKLAQILGWCTEMVNGFLLLYDDIMDGSSTRRGQSCWYKLEDVGMIAINDTIIIENAIYILLRKHFRDKECYASIMELFHEVIYATACGQCMDFLSCQKSVLSFTEEQFKTIAINKSAHYTFYLPIMLAMELAGVKDPLTVCQLKNISNEFGILFQIQNDFLDWYVNPEITGKIGSDIEDNNCSWFAVECLKRANEKQKQIMAECYGKKDPQKVLRVKQLFIALELDKAYTEYEQQAYKRIKTMIEESSDYQPKEAILHILDKSYLRKR